MNNSKGDKKVYIYNQTQYQRINNNKDDNKSIYNQIQFQRMNKRKGIIRELNS